NGVDSWQSGFLPPLYQGTRFRSTGDPVLNLRPEVKQPKDVTAAERDVLGQLDALHKRERPHQPRLDARIASYELAGRMQLAATDAPDINREPLAVRGAYGIGRQPTGSSGRRRLIGARVVG